MRLRTTSPFTLLMFLRVDSGQPPKEGSDTQQPAPLSAEADGTEQGDSSNSAEGAEESARTGP